MMRLTRQSRNFISILLILLFFCAGTRGLFCGRLGQSASPELSRVVSAVQQMGDGLSSFQSDFSRTVRMIRMAADEIRWVPDVPETEQAGFFVFLLPDGGPEYLTGPAAGYVDILLAGLSAGMTQDISKPPEV